MGVALIGMWKLCVALIVMWGGGTVCWPQGHLQIGDGAVSHVETGYGTNSTIGTG